MAGYSRDEKETERRKTLTAIRTATASLSLSLSVTNKHIRDVFIRFRIGASNIRTHKLRYVAHTPGDLMCPLCNTAYEDEMHTLFYCKFLDDLRQKYIPRKYTVQPSYATLRRMMQDKSCLHDLGRFFYHSNKRREVWPGPQQTSFPVTKV